MAVQHSQVGWGFWIRWVIASKVGLGFGFAFIFGLLGVLGEDSSLVVGSLRARYLFCRIRSPDWSFIRVSSMIVLRKWIIRSGWWAPSSSLGFALVFGMVKAFEGVAGFVLGGALLGLAKFFVLREQVARAAWWVLASMLSLAIGIAIIFALPVATSEIMSYAMSETLGSLLGGVVIGAISRGVLAARRK